MKTKKIGIILIVLGIFISTASIYAMAQNPNSDDGHSVDDDVEQIAIDFLVNAPTFSFDGIPESIEVISTYTLESYPEQHVVVISFKTTHAGWGDREGTFIAQVVTQHSIEITVVEGEVVEASIDDKWDEITQEIITPDEILMPERARDLALQHIVDNHPELGELYVSTHWITEVEPQDLLGSSTLRYIAEGWNITVKYPVIQYPDYSICAEYSGEISFHWIGNVSHDGEISETTIDIH
ncbi:MAG: hypothetical protein ACLFVP_06805 [Candidatus Bathyarchaeia archaeon]